MEVLIADPVAPEVRPGLEAMGLHVAEVPEARPDELLGLLEGVHVLIVADSRVPRRAIERASSLGLIIRAGSGVDTIDVSAASDRAIFVTHCPGHAATARAELLAGMMIALDRGLTLADPAAAARRGIAGRTMGLFGFDSAARELARMVQAMGMRVNVVSPSLTASLASEAHVHLFDDTDRLLALSDVVSLHPETHLPDPMLDADAISRLRHGAILIAAGPSGLVDVDALRPRVEAGSLSVGLDVTGPSEPPELSLACMDAAIVTRNSSTATRQACHAAAAEIIRIMNAYLTEDRVPNCTNLISKPDCAAVLIVRLTNEVGVLANVLAVLRDEGINVLECSNLLFENKSSARVALRLSAVPTPTVVQQIHRRESVLQVDVVT